MDINMVLQKVDEYYAANQGEMAEQLMRGAIEEAIAEGDNEALLQLLNELLGYYRETSRVEDSYAVADRLRELACRMGLENTIPYATTLLNIANAYRAGGRLEDSLECYKEVRVIYSEKLAGDNMLIAGLENNLSLLYQEMGDFQGAKESLLRALDIVQKKNAEFEIAVTYANLAGSCMQLSEEEEAYTYAKQAIEEFQKQGIEDAHYGAALSAMGMYFFSKKEYMSAKLIFSKAKDIMERNLGRNAYYYRLQENVEQCEKLLSCDDRSCYSGERGNEKREISGLELCREYYETYGRPMIAELFPEYADKIAVGLVGEGSDCFGYDDEISRDHDWGPDFCMWVTEETYEQIGEALEAAYAKLPTEYKGFRRTVSAQGSGRRGVQTIEGFYNRLLNLRGRKALTGENTDIGNMKSEDGRDGLSVAEAVMNRIDWTILSDAALAAAVNGAVFCDKEGIFSEIRWQLLEGYPEEILYIKLAESAARFSQAGQYNYFRCLQRGDVLTAQIMLADCVREAMKLKHYLEGKYPPHDKWLKKSCEELAGGLQLCEELQELMVLGGRLMGGNRSPESIEANAETDGGAPEAGIAGLVTSQVEKIASRLVSELYAGNYISDIDNYLDAHTEELLVKASVAGCSEEQLVDQIARLEFTAFDKVRNVGGRASCQNDWPTFYVMRKSQYLTWNKTMLMQYYYDFKREFSRGHNLIEEKYGRMMESTAPAEYEQIKQHFPYISPEKKAIIEQIVAVQVGWMEEFAKEYPHMAENARSVRTAEDHLYNTSYETYLRGEISTYSDKMLELYGRYVVAYATENKNLAYEIMSNSARMYGYADVDAAENKRHHKCLK